MAFNGRQSARKHARRIHICSKCGQTIKGNGYSNHKLAHEKKEKAVRESGRLSTVYNSLKAMLSR